MKFLNETGLAHLWANLKTLLQGKQDTLTAGTGIDITNNVISATGGEGASYTAGNSIDIDSNNIITNTQLPNSIGHFVLLSLLGLSSDGVIGDSWTLTRNSTEDEVKTVLNSGQNFMVTTQPLNNSKMSQLLYNAGIRYVYKLADNGTFTNIMISSSSGWSSSNNWMYCRCGRLLIGVSRATYGERLAKGLVDYIYYDNTTSGLTASTLKGAIDELANQSSGGTTYTAGANISINNGEISATDTTYTAGTNVSITNGVISATDTTYTAGTGISISNGEISSTIQGIPTAPANDGTYMLKCVVSSGTPTYSWESITVGGSY